MNPEPNQRQLDALEKYLRGELDASHPDLPVEETVLARQLRAVVVRQQPDPQFVASLNGQLTQLQRETTSPQRPGFRYLLSSLAGLAALVLLAFLLRWLILSVAPEPPVPAIPFTQTPAPEVSSTAPAATATPPAPVPTDATQYYAPLFSEPYSLAASFPAGPAQGNLYEQFIPETATLETAHLLAAKFGLNGKLYLSPGTAPNGTTVFVATDGKQRLYIYSPERYDYYSDWVRLVETFSNTQPAQSAASQAETYLKAHNLLDFPYQVETSPESPGLVSFVPTLDGLPLRYSSGHTSPRLRVQISSQGQVASISADLPSYKPVAGSYPLRTAENAWKKVIGDSTDLGLVADFSNGSGYPPKPVSKWFRTYPLGQPLSLGGMFEKLPPAEGGAPLFSLNNYPLSGNLAGLEKLSDGEKILAQGQFVQDGEAQIFQVESWQKTDRFEILTGTLERSGEQVFVVSHNGRRLELPDLPPEAYTAAQSDEFHAFGVELEGRFDWSSVTIGPLGGGGCDGQCGGVTSLAKLNLSDTPFPTATPQVIAIATSVPVKVVIGQRVEGVLGTLHIFIFESKDGQQRMEAMIQSDSMDGNGTYNLANGPALAGIEKYNFLPVRVWGTVSGSGSDGNPLLTIERYEPLYPGLEAQSWVGKQEISTVQGKSVLLFTSEDGRVYVKNESLQPGFDAANWPPGEGRIFVQGFVLPGKDWGGYPVIDMPRSVITIDNNTQSLEELQKLYFGGNQPDVLPDEGAPVIPTGAKIEKIELVYLAKDLSGVPELTDPIYMQPAWSFRGHYSDGTPFEIYVQALTDTYLLPEPDQ